MMLSDMGADVVRIDRRDAALRADPGGRPTDLMGRNRRSVGVDLKHPDGVDLVLRIAGQADALIEGFRPGVTERLGLGPAVCLERNPRLVYGRITGWGQEGPLAHAAGHDINYISIAGALDPIGRAGEAPVPPLNLVGDYGGGGMLLAFGIACALFEAARSGKGQVVDAAMVDGAALLLTQLFELREIGMWDDARGTNILDTGAPFYDVYETADGGYVSVGAIEPQFWAELAEKAGLPARDETRRWDKGDWAPAKEQVAAVFRTLTRAEWCALLEGTDACFAPVLSVAEAPTHPHNVLRKTFIEVEGIIQPAPAPRFSRTPGAVTRPPGRPGKHGDEALLDWGVPEDEIARLRSTSAIA